MSHHLKVKETCKHLGALGYQFHPFYHLTRNKLTGLIGDIKDCTIYDKNDGFVVITRYPLIESGLPGQIATSVCTNPWSSDRNEDLTYVLEKCGSIWKDSILSIAPIPTHLIEDIEKVASKQGFRLKTRFDCQAFVLTDMDRFKKQKQAVNIPPEFEIKSLSPKDATYVAETWKYSSQFTASILEEYLRYPEVFHSSGVFKKFQQQPVSLAIVGQFGDISIEYTHPEYRRRGFMKAVICDLATKMLDRNDRPYVVISKSNDASLEIHKKLGFSLVEDGGISWTEFENCLSR
ncbi:uncharacterized protein LOC144436974 [Glandiceps talaboti]